MVYYFAVSVAFVLCVQLVQCRDAYTSVYEMDGMLDEENILIGFLSDFIFNLQSEITMLHHRYSELLTAAESAASDGDSPVSDPLHAYSLIKRLVKEWPLMLTLVSNSYTLPEWVPSLPSELDVLSAYRGLFRLQEVYGLNTTSLARMRDTAASSLTADELFELGKYSYGEREFLLAQSWLQLSLESLGPEHQTSRAEIMAYMYLAKVFHGCKTENTVSRDVHLVRQLVMDNPSLTLKSDLSQDFMISLSNNCSLMNQYLVKPVVFDNDLNETETEMYHNICREGAPVRHELKCQYVTYGHAGLLIAPFKLEEVHLDPPIIMIHDVIHDHETHDMATTFYTVMEDCQIVSNKAALINSFRTCNVGWIPNEMTPVAARMTERVGRFTNLSVTVSEYNQVAAYGIGGEFKIHMDAFPKSLSHNDTLGNRIVTVLIYLNDVDEGGHTVFPYLNVSVKPRKGSAVIWHNILVDGTPDFRTKHASCPVLQGTKWILNKWIREGGQEFQYACPLNRTASRKYYYL